MRIVLLVVIVGSVLVAGCGGSSGGPDTGGGPMDTGGPGPDAPAHDAWVYVPQDGGACTSSTQCPGSYCNTGSHTCCVRAIPPIEICGDHIDQDCDGHDAPCGDNDMDQWQACRPPTPPATTVDWSMCDCDDMDPQTYPARGSIPGGREICDGKDNDCDLVIDESPMCCTTSPSCTGGPPSGTCGCEANAGGAPCATGQTCCSTGCVDTNTDFMNCGFCGSQCTPQNDRCTAGMCHCGTGPSCAFINMCSGGACH